MPPAVFAKFLAKWSCVDPVFGLSFAAARTTTAMLKTSITHQWNREAAPAAPVRPCLHSFLADGRGTGYTSTLAGGCER